MKKVIIAIAIVIVVGVMMTSSNKPSVLTDQEKVAQFEEQEQEQAFIEAAKQEMVLIEQEIAEMPFMDVLDLPEPKRTVAMKYYVYRIQLVMIGLGLVVMIWSLFRKWRKSKR